MPFAGLLVARPWFCQHRERKITALFCYSGSHCQLYPVHTESAMAEQPAIPEPHPSSPAAARAALHQLIDRLSDEEATALWRLICSWVVPPSRQPSEE